MMPAISTILRRGKNIFMHGAYIPAEYFVFDEHRVVYIAIPKVACTSIKLAIKGDQSDLATDKEGVMAVHRNLTSKCSYTLRKSTKNYTIFAFVRNPFDRLVSCYEDKVKKETQHNGVYYFSSGYNRIFLKALLGSSFTPDMSFEKFIELVSRIPDVIADGHFKSQYSTLYKHGKRVPHIIGKFETLNEDWESIASKLALGDLTSNNKTYRSEWTEYYKSSETIELVHKRFRKDIELFDYESSYKELLSLSLE